MVVDPAVVVATIGGAVDRRGSPLAIRFNYPTPVGREIEYITQATLDGRTSMAGPFTERVSEILREAHDAPEVLLTASCTDALEMSAMLLDIKPGDVVIVPSFTFVSTALAFAREGAQIRFCDIEPTTLGVDPESVAALMDDRVRAIVPVHYAGVGCAINEIQTIAESTGRVEVVEDNAHGLFGAVDGKPLGSFGRFSTLSFHETKNFVCGEGGALVINDEADVDRAYTLRDKGTNRRQFMQGNVAKYTWVDTGSSFGMSDILAAYLLAQLEQKDEVLAARKRIIELYSEALTDLQAEFGVTLPTVPADRTSAYHMFYLLLATAEQRSHVLAKMNADDIHPTFHYLPLHRATAAANVTDGTQSCPVTDDVSARLLRLPFYNTLSESDVDQVVTSLSSALRSAGG